MLFRRSPSSRRAKELKLARSRRLRRSKHKNGLRFEALEQRQVLATLAIGDAVAVMEGDALTTDAVFAVTLTPEGGDVDDTVVTVNFATADVSATAPADYIAQANTLSFTLDGAAQTQMITIAVNGDLLDEQDETFQVNLSGAVNATVTDAQGIGTITDDDPTPTLAIDDPMQVEGDAGTVNMVFTVTLSAASGQQVTVEFDTADVSAVAPADYVAQSNTLTFAPGTTTQTVTIAVNGDLLDEANETFQVNLSDAVNANITDPQGIGTITDDDPTPTLVIGDASVAEGDAGTTDMVFTVTLSAASGQQVTVVYTTANATAVAPADYIAQTNTLTFAPGTTTQTVTIAVNGDLLDEANETFQVNLSTAVNATIADPQAIGTINDNDPTPTLAINDAMLVEGDAGASNMVFTVTLSAVSGQPVTVQFATANVTATAPADYVAQSGTLTFAPGTTTQTVTIAINGDIVDEPNETFQVNLVTPVNATIADPQGIGTITDNDPPMVSINDVAQAEGDEGTTNLVFTVTLSSASGVPVTVQFATANGTAIAPNDYTAQSGTVTFAIGETQRTLTIAVRGETTHEIDENFLVNLSGPSGANLGDGQGVGVILNDDSPQFIVTGASQGGGPRVRVFNPNNGVAVHDFYAFDPNFLGGVTVATGDFNMDGVADIVTAAGPGGGPHIRVFDGETGQQLPGLIGSFFAYGSSFSGGVFVAAADVNGDSVADIITGAGQGGGPHVRVFNGANGAVLADFFAFDPSFTGGVRVAVGQVQTGGTPEIITAAGPGGGPHVRVFTSTGSAIGGPTASFFAYAPSFTGGVYVAAGDVNDDGQVDIVTGAGQGGGPHVRTINGATGVQLAEPAGSFFAFEGTFTGGVRVAIGNITGDGGAEIITGAGPGGQPRLRAFRGPDLPVVSDFNVYESSFEGGIFVAGTTAGLSPGSPLLAANVSGASGQATPLSEADLSIELIAALERRLGVSLADVRIDITDLPAGHLGRSQADSIQLDRDAAGLGWFIDPTPMADEEFGNSTGSGSQSLDDRPAAGHIDLLTVLAHEIAHLRGLEHVDAAEHLLSATLSTGQRRISRLDALDTVLASDW